MYAAVAVCCWVSAGAADILMLLLFLTIVKPFALRSLNDQRALHIMDLSPYWAIERVERWTAAQVN